MPQPLDTPPRISHHLRVAFAAALLIVGLSGCSGANLGTPAPSTLPGLAAGTLAPTTAKTTPAKADDADYRNLLLSAADLSDADDTFTARSTQSQPNGSPGASAFFVNGKDNRAITDTFLLYSDAATATATLKQAAGTLPTLVAGGTPKPIAVGSDGVMISGSYPEDAKAVTLLFFTEGRALVRLEFQSAAGDTTTDQFVTSVGKMQQIALRVGLTNPQ